MKKLVILGTALLALNAIASEGQLKFGYDFSRDAKYGEGENLKFKKDISSITKENLNGELELNTNYLQIQEN